MNTPAWKMPTDRTPATPAPVDTHNPDACDTHGATARREYDFGKYRDATVVVYACGCAATFFNNGFNDPGALYSSYNDAAGRARMAVAIASSRY